MDPPKDRKEGETSHLGAIVLLVMFGILAALVCGETWQALKTLPPYVGRTLTEEETAEIVCGYRMSGSISGKPNGGNRGRGQQKIRG